MDGRLKNRFESFWSHHEHRHSVEEPINLLEIWGLDNYPKMPESDFEDMKLIAKIRAKFFGPSPRMFTIFREKRPTSLRELFGISHPGYDPVRFWYLGDFQVGKSVIGSSETPDEPAQIASHDVHVITAINNEGEIWHVKSTHPKEMSFDNLAPVSDELYRAHAPDLQTWREILLRIEHETRYR